ncbi:hypothetical protein P8452_66425 [Trifolium repens]|nr:hypothetical protein P8452_56016 [Trifolium repens]WJX83790.1 hypothetical protein P8452_66425 [Trifolium repens]
MTFVLYLTKLNISGCSTFSANALAYLAGFCRKLKVLSLCGCVRAPSDTALQCRCYILILKFEEQKYSEAICENKHVQYMPFFVRD